MSRPEIRSDQQRLKQGTRLPDLVEEYAGRIEENNQTINAVVSTQFDYARRRATEIQKKLDEGTAGPLAGAVMGIKDVICQEGEKVTCGSHMLRNFESIYTATAVDRLVADDAILIGRMNNDEFAMGSSTENTIHQPTRNPHDTSRVPGGSSGGSAAAVAADMANAALGTDTGGSIRQPASFCGVVGLKPTYGRVSRYGLVAYASSFDCIGPFTHSVYDAALVLNSLAGRDPHDATTADVKVPDYTESVTSPESRLKIGVPAEYFGDGLDDEVRTRIEEVLNKLKGEGAELVEINLPHLKYAIATYYILATAEASSNLARYDGVRYGHRAEFKDVQQQLSSEEKELKKLIKENNGQQKEELQEQLEAIDSPLIRLYKQSRNEGFGTEVKRRIMLGTYVLSAGYYDAYYGKAQRVRRLIRQDFMDAFKNVDVIASPTAPTTAFKVGENQDDPVKMYLNDIYTISANLAGISGLNVPVGRDSKDLPIGMQFMANAFEEPKLFNAGALAEGQFHQQKT